MFWRDYGAWPFGGTRTEQLQCPNCHNTTDHVVYEVPKGPQLGLIFTKEPLLGFRSYYLVCPTCGYMTKQLTKAQALAMRVPRCSS